jgi:hypothetical protein
MALKLRIMLSEAPYRCLLEHLSETAPAYKPLASAAQLQGSATLADQYVVNCDEDDAKSLLAAAEHDCPAAVQPIKAGLIAAQARKERDR